MDQKSNAELIELAAFLVQQNDYEQILRITAHHIASTLHADSALILLINPQTRQTVKTVVREGKMDENRKYRHVHDQLCGWILENRQPLLVENIRTDQRFENLLLKDLKVNSVLGAPIQIEGILIGVLLALNLQGSRIFGQDDVEYLKSVAIIAAPYLRNAQKIRDYFESPLPQAALLTKFSHLGLLGKSEPFVNVLKAIEAAARCDVRVLLEGRSGTGKGVIARAIHELSERRGKPFKAIDCGAIPENLVESELFGHVKGAFTGATQNRKGLLLEANGGTLFLDEIANLSLNMQAKFMRALQDSEVRPVGSDIIHKMDVRIIAASSYSLKQMVERGKFREDLYYRLNVFPLKIASLDERKDDIPILADAFLQKFAQEQKKLAKSFHESIIDFIKVRPWPGNIRELENFVERLVATIPAKVEIIAPNHLPEELKEELDKINFDEAYASASLPERVEAFEKELILKALAKHNWKQAKAARELKISAQALRYKLERLDIRPLE